MLIEELDEELQEALEEAGVQSLNDAKERGRSFWLAHFANREGFAFDFDMLLADLGVTWEEAPSCSALQVPPDELEIHTATLVVLETEGIQTMAEAFLHPREQWLEKMANRTGVLEMLEEALGTQKGSW